MIVLHIGLMVKEKNGEFFWSTVDVNSFGLMKWEQIPESLYDEIVKFEEGDQS